MNSFSGIGLSDQLLQAISDKGYTKPSPIQAQAIPVVLKGLDLMAAAQTGTGKTAAFTLPMIESFLKKGPSNKRPLIKGLILTPTRELASQIQENILAYSAQTSLSSMVMFGGVKAHKQIAKLKQGVDIVVATPGRLLDLVNQGVCKLNDIETLVLDEADRMLDMGFINDIRKIMKVLPKKRQTLLFSATFSREIKALANDFLKSPKFIEISPENTAAVTITQTAYRCDQAKKANAVIKLIQDGNLQQVLIFTRTKHGADRLSKTLMQSDIRSSAIHGNKSQGAREKALGGFKDKTIRVLVATDIAARGIDISDLPYVINYELPNVAADYVHRIGRTGRAGKEGVAVSLVCNDERPFFTGIEKLTGAKIPLLDLEGLEPKQWTMRAPTASEVLKKAEDKKRAARQARGPRPKQGGGAGGGYKGKGSKKPSSQRSGNSGGKRRG